MVRKLTRNGIQYFDAGGAVLPIGGNVAPASNLVGSLTGQSGYVAQLAPTTDVDYTGILNPAAADALYGSSQISNNMYNQNVLADALKAQAARQQQIANGQGPNPALDQLNQTTGNNIAAQNALIAGVRGGSANAGLVARLAAQRGGQLQQQATGQAATLSAEQQLAAGDETQKALTAAGGVYNNLGTETVAEQGANNQLFGLAAGAQNNQNNSLVNNYGMAQGLNANTAANNATASGDFFGRVLSGAGAAAGTILGKSKSPVNGSPGGTSGEGVPGGGGEYPTSSGTGGTGGEYSPYALGGYVGDHMKHVMRIYHPHLMKRGGIVPGKAKVKGDSLKNDTVKTMLSPDEIVLPRSVTTAEDAPEQAKLFVAKLQEKERGKPGDKSDFREALKKAISNRRSSYAA